MENMRENGSMRKYLAQRAIHAVAVVILVTVVLVIGFATGSLSQQMLDSWEFVGMLCFALPLAIYIFIDPKAH